ncbi:MAG: T9SS type A sorting domain-containing protein, partial [FCB group bacterium]
GGNHLSLIGDKLIVTVNGSGKILIYDLVTKTLEDSISTNTGQYDGPREAVEFGNSVIYTTYQGYLKISDLKGKILDSVKTHGKCEGLDIILGSGIYFVVANISLPDYSPDSDVTIYSYVDDVSFKNNPSISYIYPNPTDDLFTFEINNNGFNSQNAILEISSLEGKILGANTNPIISDNRIKFVISTKELNLSPGIYFARMKNGNNTSAKLFCVIR